MSLKILFLTTHNLATNPRLVKEMELAVRNGYKVELVCFEFDNWSRELNEELKKKFSTVNMHTIPAGRKPLLPWLWSVVTESFCRAAGRLFPLPENMLSQAVSRRSQLLIRALNKVSRPDLIITHNVGAIFPGILASRKFGSPGGFDVEDYYPGEGNNKSLHRLSKRLMFLFLPAANYLSFASTMIMEQVDKDTYGLIAGGLTVLNYFPSSEFIEPVEQMGPLKLVWFSQNINQGRGLELVLPFINQFPGKLELHLIGNCNSEFYENYLEDVENIYVHDPLPQDELHRSLSNYDIGLALEPAKDRNNELALSNKLFAYLQAGLYVVATNTPAQEDFLKDFPDHGMCFNYRENNFEGALRRILVNKELIRSQRVERFENFKNRNWAAEAEKLLAKWNSLTR